jgi:hypothetical protein
MTTVTLSRLLLFNEFFMMHSAPRPRLSCTSGYSQFFTVFQMQFTQSSSLSLSKIPSQPIITKSCVSSSLKD